MSRNVSALHSPAAAVVFHVECVNWCRLNVTEDGKKALITLANGDMRKVLNILQVVVVTILLSKVFPGCMCYKILHRWFAGEENIMRIVLCHLMYCTCQQSFSVFLSRLKTFLFLVFSSKAIYLLLRLTWNLTTRCLAVTGNCSVCECARSSQPSGLLGTLPSNYLLT